MTQRAVDRLACGNSSFSFARIPTPKNGLLAFDRSSVAKLHSGRLEILFCPMRGAVFFNTCASSGDTDLPGWRNALRRDHFPRAGAGSTHYYL